MVNEGLDGGMGNQFQGLLQAIKMLNTIEHQSVKSPVSLMRCFNIKILADLAD
jgi:hypothetical protein